MGTVILSVVGILSYLWNMEDFTLKTIISAFTDVNNVVAWGCALAATARCKKYSRYSFCACSDSDWRSGIFIQK